MGVRQDDLVGKGWSAMGLDTRSRKNASQGSRQGIDTGGGHGSRAMCKSPSGGELYLGDRIRNSRYAKVRTCGLRCRRRITASPISSRRNGSTR